MALMKYDRFDPMSVYELLEKKHKLPTVIELLDKTTQKIGPTYLAKDIEYDYTNMNKVAKGAVKLPLVPTILLARLNGYTDEDGVFMYVLQQKPDPNAPPKSRAPRKRKPKVEASATTVKKTKSTATKK